MKKHKILITGSSRGIGKALAEHYLEAGHEIWGCSRSKSSIKHDNYVHYTLDLTHEKQVRSMFDQISRQDFRFDVLINNTGKASLNSIMLIPYQTVQEVTNLNVNAFFLISREAAKWMLLNKVEGRVINLSSTAATLSLEGEAIYAASKAAVESLTKTMSRELASTGITVNALGISLYKSNLTNNVPCQKLQKVLDEQPIGRWARTSDITNTLDYFISPSSDFITGQIIYLAGIR